ncbi:MAG TPA: murein biosynthesis integral membrane protein MurJ [Roseiflexaceae bacterium]|nr:murein biosynthesis integral membrane protein MurJ [Roseiflexaceae bacterium]
MASSHRERALGRAGWGPLANTLIVAGGTLLSRVLGLARDVIIAGRFGTGVEIEAYRAAFALIDMVYIVVAGGALGSAFIPVFAGMLAQEREGDAWRLASGTINLALAALVLACGLMALLAEPLVALTVGQGFDAAQRGLTVDVLRLLLIQPVLLGLGGLAKATLESFDRFALPAIGSNLYNLGIIAGALLLAPWGVYGLVAGVLGGAALFLLVQLPGLRTVGMRYTPTLGLDLPGLRQIGRLLGPRLFGQSAWQLGLIAIASVASTLGQGAVAANANALQLMMLPHGLIALSLGTVIFPQLARLYGAGDLAGLRATALGAVRSVLFLALPAAALLAALREPVLRAIYQRGAFNALSTALTAEALLFYALGLAAFAAAEIIVRTFYAMQDTRTPVLVGIGTVLVNIALAVTLPRLLGLGGLGLSFSIANTLEAGILLWLLGRRLGGLPASFWGGLGRMLLAALILGAALAALLALSAGPLPFLASGDTYRWPDQFIPLLAWLAAASALGAAVYTAAAALLRLDELPALTSRLGALVGRLKRNS